MVEKAVHAKLFQMVKEDPGVEVTVDLESQALLLPGGESVPFPIDPYSKKCLLQGLDDLGYLLSFSAKIAEHEKNAL